MVLEVSCSLQRWFLIPKVISVLVFMWLFRKHLLSVIMVILACWFLRDIFAIKWVMLRDLEEKYVALWRGAKKKSWFSRMSCYCSRTPCTGDCKEAESGSSIWEEAVALTATYRALEAECSILTPWQYLPQLSLSFLSYQITSSIMTSRTEKLK